MSDPCLTVTVDEAAAMLGCSARTIWRRLRWRRFPVAAIRNIDRRVRFPRHLIEALGRGELNGLPLGIAVPRGRRRAG